MSVSEKRLSREEVNILNRGILAELHDKGDKQVEDILMGKMTHPSRLMIAHRPSA